MPRRSLSLRTATRRLLTTLAMLGTSVLFSACQEVTVPNYNSPNIDGLLDRPDAASVNTSVVGLLVGARGTVGAYATTLGIFGREMYNLDQADARFVLSWLVEPLTPGGFGIDIGWSGTYRQLLTAQTILDIVDKVPDLSTPQKEGIKGLTKTFMALGMMDQLRVRDTFGIVLTVDPTANKLGDFVSREEVEALVAAYRCPPAAFVKHDETARTEVSGSVLQLNLQSRVSPSPIFPLSTGED